MTRHTYTAVVEKEGDLYVALCPELDVASQGDTVEQARANLKEAVELFLETADPKEVERLVLLDGQEDAGRYDEYAAAGADHLVLGIAHPFDLGPAVRLLERSRG